MSPFFKDTVAALLNCAQRHANHEHAKVQISAFEAINDLVRAASRDTLDVVAQLIQVCPLPALALKFFKHKAQSWRNWNSTTENLERRPPPLPPLPPCIGRHPRDPQDL